MLTNDFARLGTYMFFNETNGKINSAPFTQISLTACSHTEAAMSFQ